jgi:hypothetical protein
MKSSSKMIARLAGNARSVVAQKPRQQGAYDGPKNPRTDHERAVQAFLSEAGQRLRKARGKAPRRKK